LELVTVMAKKSWEVKRKETCFPLSPRYVSNLYSSSLQNQSLTNRRTCKRPLLGLRSFNKYFVTKIEKTKRDSIEMEENGIMGWLKSLRFDDYGKKEKGGSDKKCE
ncbi:hypothetical protein PanWU01x14_346730, partial [Parasponia andersonii]